MSMPVAGLSSSFGFFVDSRAVSWIADGDGEEGVTYRTGRASSSIGAPDRTAAGRTSVSSLPFITRFGTGENVL